MERFNQSFADGKQEIDIDAKYLPKGRYRLGQNITVATSESSDKGVVQNIRGNRQVPFAFSDPVSIGATTIGHGVDTLNNKIYWFFIGNTTEGVYEFDPVQNMVFRILEVSRYRRILNFNVNNRITGVNIIGGDLYWTDNLNEPRQINIERFRGTVVDPVQDASNPPVPLASLLVNTIANTNEVQFTTSFSSDLIGLGKRPPLFPITLVNPHVDNPYGTPGSPLYDKFVYFSYYYIYRNGQESVLAPFTCAAFYPENFSVSRDTGVLDCMVNRYKSVDLKYDVGDEEVREIVLVFKESNNSLLYELTTINKSTAGITQSSTPVERRYRTFSYDSEKVYRTLPSNKLTDVYDNVPLRAQAQDFVGNRLVFGNTIENYPLKTRHQDGPDLALNFSAGLKTTRKNESDLSPSRSIKSNRYYEIGIQYLDRLNRQTPALIPTVALTDSTISSNTVFVPFENSVNRNQLEITIEHEAPYWATHWRTSIKQVKGAFYSIFPINTVVPSSGNRAYLQIPSLESNQTTDERSGVTSTINKVRTDDIIVFKAVNKTNGRAAEEIRREYRIVDVGFIDADTANITGLTDDGVYITISPVVNGELSAIPNGNATTVFETVPEDEALDIYTEYGQTYRVDNGLHTTATEDVVKLDDTRQVRAENGSVGSLTATLCWFNCFSYSNGVEAMFVRDEFFGQRLDAGVRATTVQENYRERNNLSRLIHSGVFNDDQNQNRLNQFSVSQNISHELDMFDGSIQKLHARNTNLIVFQEDKVKLVPINKNLVTTADGSESFSVSSAFFNTEQAYTGNYGISRNPDSFAEYGANIYWVDENRGCVCRLSPSGIDEISRYGGEVLFRTASKEAPLVVAGYDQFHKRYVPCFRNLPEIDRIPIPGEAVISQDGTNDPRTEYQRDVNVTRFVNVFIEMRDAGSTIDVGDAVFVNSERTNPFNGGFRWYRRRQQDPMTLVFTYDQVFQISPEGVIINFIPNLPTAFATQVVRNSFGISVEKFIDEYDACANGVVDSVAYFGCPLNADGTEQMCTINSGDAPIAGQVVYENRPDLVPSNRTGWFLTIENNLQYAINIEKGVVIERIDCREISLGRRQAQGSNPLVIDARESDFLRNQRICNVNTGATTYYWSGNRDLPQAGETVFTSNFENIVATPNRFIVFQDGSFVQLDANSVVTADGIRSCSTPQCTSDVESLFSIDDINENVLSTINTDGGALLGTNIVAFDRTTSIAARTDNVAQIYQREIGPTVETIVPTDANTRWDRQTVGDNNRYEWIIILPTNSNIFDLLRNNERVGGAGRNLLIFRDQSNWALLTLNVAVQSVVGDAVIARMSVEESKGVVGNTLNLYIDTANNRVTEALMSSDYTPVFRGINVGSRFLPIRGAEIRWFVQGEVRYPTSGTFLHTATEIQPLEEITLQVPSGINIVESNVNVILTEVCYVENPANQATRTIFRTAAGSDPAAICGLQTTTSIFYDEITQAYYTDNMLTTRFDGGTSPNNFYGVADVDNASPTSVQQIDSNGIIIEQSTVFCATRNPISLSYVPEGNQQSSCTAALQRYFADNTDFSSSGASSITTLTLPDGSGTTAPDGIYSNRVNIRRMVSGVLQANEFETCNINAQMIEADFGDTAQSACHIDNTVNIFTDTDSFNAQTTVLYSTSNLDTLASTGYYQVGNMVAFWSAPTLTFDFQGTCPVQPTFTFADAGVTCSVNSAGTITVGANAGTVDSFDPASFTSVTEDTPRDINVTVNVPSGFLNTGSTVTGICSTTQGALPTFSFNDAGVTCSITQAGVVSVSATQGTVASFTPTNVGTTSTERTVDITVNVTAPATGFTNSGSNVSGICRATQIATSATLPTFTFADAGVSCSVATNGDISVSASIGTATNDPVQNFGALTGNNTMSRIVNVRVQGTIPSGFMNAGTSFNLTGTCTTTQQGPGLSAYTPTISTAVDNNAGTITVTDTGAGTVTNVRNNTFTPFTGDSRMQTVTFDVTIPNGFLNAGGTLADRTVSVTIGPRDFVASDWTGSFSVAQNGDISFEQGNSAATITNLSANPSGANTGENARDVAVTGRITIPSGYMNTGSTIDITRTVSQPGMPVSRTLSASPTSVSLAGNGQASPAGSGNITITTLPTAGTWNHSISDNWIVATRLSGTGLRIEAEENPTFGTRSGTVTLTHSEDQSVTETINVSQLGVGAGGSS